jgi:helicase
MSYKAAFIGVGKHASPLINDLNGAKKDAIALHALFIDNIKNLESTRLVDEEATHEQIRQLLVKVLLDATAEDTVIVSFAGHGSGDHRLVAYNTEADSRFENTTIAMTELAELFSKSKAKAILCLLDCCFSGEAPARVFPGWPQTRSHANPFYQIAGTGRVLIAACAVDEYAYEDPRAAHGLLTKAFLEVVQEISEPTETLAIAAEISRRVRGDAARLMVSQNPAIHGNIEGGLTFPPFVKGKLFLEFFPDLDAVQTDGTLASLADFGIPETVIQGWDERFRSENLNELQTEAINNFRIMQGESLLVVAPTSSGKTFIGEAAAIKAVLEGRKAVFLLPYKALTNEKFDEFSSLYGEVLGLRVIRVTGDRSDTAPDFVRGKYDLALLTYEMFLNLIVGNSQVLRTLGLVVLDEAQFITDPGRGINVELLLTYLLASRDNGINPQIIALSAVIGGINYFDEWLDCKALVTEERPVPLTEGVMDRNGTYQFLDAEGNAKTDQLIPPVYRRRDKESSQDMIVPLVQHLLAENSKEKIIVFRNQKGSAKGCANYLSQDLQLNSAHGAIAQLPELDGSDASNKLRIALTGGTAFHTSDLSRDEKQIVERVYRDPNSEVRILAATTGVAAGINTPASTVILAEQEFLGEDNRPFLISEYKNMAGRAGRKGFNEKGKSIILASNANERAFLFSKYVLGELEPLQSSFSEDDLATWVLKLLTQVASIPQDEVAHLLGRTYGGFLRIKLNPDWLLSMKMEVESLLERMLKLGIAEIIDEEVQLTPLGGACGRSSFSFKSAMRFVEILKNQGSTTLTPERLLALVQVLQEMDEGVYTPVYKRGSKEQARANEVRSKYGHDIASILQTGVGQDNFKWLGRCKRAVILWDWINGRDVLEIENHYSVTPFQGTITYGNIIGIANATRYHLRSAMEILQALVMTEAIDEERFDDLILQLEEGLPRDALELLKVPISLSRGEMLLLHRSNISNPDQILDNPKERIEQILGKEKAVSVIGAIRN